MLLLRHKEEYFVKYQDIPLAKPGVVQAWVGQKRLNYYILSLFCDVR
jgi:hypothetical protein